MEEQQVGRAVRYLAFISRWATGAGWGKVTREPILPQFVSSVKGDDSADDGDST